MIRRSNPSESYSSDESAIVKAAAWAWYQRGSGSEGKPTSEYDAARTRRPQTPSRYKLEALRSKGETTAALARLSPTRAGNSLLDTYEIERISKQLDFYIESSMVVRRRGVSSPEGDMGASGLEIIEKKKKKSRKGRGLWASRGVLPACGSRDDVVETARIDRGRLPEKWAAAVGRRQASHI